ncbi:MAG: hypothetical protein ILO53_01965 [Clostridia bacterium]|nr:hypothetical protein [Clostridia bacterium]
MRSTFLFSPDKLSPSRGDSLLDADFIYLSCIPLLTGGRQAREDSLEKSSARAFEESLTDFRRRAAAAKSPEKVPKILLSTPFISKGRLFAGFCEKFAEFAPLFDGFILQNIGDAALIEKLTAEAFGAPLAKPDGKRFLLAGDTAFNITNRESAEYWSGRLDVLAILPELTAAAQQSLAQTFPGNIIPEITAFSTAVITRSEHCLAAQGGFGCGKCGPCGLDAGRLIDERGRRFDIVTDPLDCTSLLLGRTQEAPPAGSGGFAGLLSPLPKEHVTPGARSSSAVIRRDSGDFM